MAGLSSVRYALMSMIRMPVLSLAVERRGGVDIDRVEGLLPVEFGVDVELHEFDRAVARELADDREARHQGP